MPNQLLDNNFDTFQLPHTFIVQESQWNQLLETSSMKFLRGSIGMIIVGSFFGLCFAGISTFVIPFCIVLMFLIFADRGRKQKLLALSKHKYHVTESDISIVFPEEQKETISYTDIKYITQNKWGLDLTFKDKKKHGDFYIPSAVPQFKNLCQHLKQLKLLEN